MSKFEIGSRVYSVKVGSKKAFVGTIVDRVSSSVYHVRADDDGRLWHRASRELKREVREECKTS